ncbi:hypothetical protein LJX78_02440 [Methanimicrococcus blatticola]|uniref:hypothetical protein n=1 Tax=Methanimicrococcus blatticola TaxID=91560 RepID=UPI001E4E4B45|nr:hypothetical protein [Methanimicrococcus blatticola]MCC2508469.1 hypothetical protein [Methanimicrococcus blatticola]
MTVNVECCCTFAGWTPEIVAVTEDAVYTASYDESLIDYTVTWKDYDGTELDVEIYNFNDMPSYKLADPVRADENGISYTFAGWTPLTVTMSTITVVNTVFRHFRGNGVINQRFIVRGGVNSVFGDCNNLGRPAGKRVGNTVFVSADRVGELVGRHVVEVVDFNIKFGAVIVFPGNGVINQRFIV